MRSSWLVCALAFCAGCASPPRHADYLDWCLGTWHGVRRSGEDGSEAPMTLRVERLAGGPGVVERLQVENGPQPYVGFSVRVPDTSGRWLMIYANSTRDTFARLEGELEPQRSVWNSITPGRSRGSRLVSEQLDADHWRRTQLVSDDGGRTWRVLFTDELTRDG